MRLLWPSLACLLGCLAFAPAAGAAVAAEPWPPREARIPLFAHLGEERWDHVNGAAVLTRAVADTARYRPDLVTLSGDKAANGTGGELSAWRAFMAPFDRAGVRWFPAVGNGDRQTPALFPPGMQGLGPFPADLGSLQAYKGVFADRPYPFGDASAPAGDPAGASTHYFVDSGAVRWIVLDNSCWSVSRCDRVQNPPLPDGQGQFAWLERRADEASRAGRTVLLAMHMPTRDPREATHVDPQSAAFVMGRDSAFGDNGRLEDIVARTGVDAVFAGNIRAMTQYRGLGRVPYFVDGGAGGDLHTNGPVGTDHGYWHGYRLIRVSRGRVVTDAVPVFVEDGITIRGADVVRRGALERYEAVGRQPGSGGARKVEALALRDPRPPAANLPAPARMFTSSNSFVLGPKAPATDDARRDPLTQTKNGLFRARCPGRATVRVTSGWETATKAVRVPSRPGPVVRAVRLTSRRTLRLRLRPRLAHRVARVRLAQPAEVLALVRRRGRTVRVLEHVCAKRGVRELTVVWDGRVGRRGRLVPRGSYRLEVRVRSDRPTVLRQRIVRVTR
jgi:hypothetical protein